jgi:hypothetical protein
MLDAVWHIIQWHISSDTCERQLRARERDRVDREIKGQRRRGEREEKKRKRKIEKGRDTAPLNAQYNRSAAHNTQHRFSRSGGAWCYILQIY